MRLYTNGDVFNIIIIFCGLTLAAQAKGHSNSGGNRRGKDKIMSEITYHQHGDYLLPDIILSEYLGEYPPIVRYGKMRRAFLREHAPITYNRLLLTEQLFPHLRDVDAIANERRKNGCPESLIIREIVCEL
ncbi:hypothetical protein FACS1894202_02560 [Clostridia bacterium]|nr:hypothetical protein FACS1894202_02560 [Clostridia bacterium]